MQRGTNRNSRGSEAEQRKTGVRGVWMCAVDRVMHLTAITTAEGIEAVPSNTHE